MSTLRCNADGEGGVVAHSMAILLRSIRESQLRRSDIRRLHDDIELFAALFSAGPDAPEATSHYRELGILSRPASIFSLTPGHVMVTISSPGRGEEAFGFYPDGVRDEFTQAPLGTYTTVAVVRIDEAQYRAIKQRIEDWRDTGYVLGIRDCTDFVGSVLESARLAPVADAIWPATYGERSEQVFGRGGVRCLIGER